MDDVQRAEEALVEAMTTRWQEAQRNDEWNDYDECIRGLLAALSGVTIETDCPTCGGCPPNRPKHEPWFCEDEECHRGRVMQSALSVWLSAQDVSSRSGRS